jgi:serine/threonine protein kinase
VWLAHDADLGREVGLKELRPDRGGHAEARCRFLKEAQITGQLEHPSIVPVYELARRPEDGQPFYAMRLVHGRTLRDAIAAFHGARTDGGADPLEQRRLLTAFASVCQAVACAHARGVIHRDLKPHNVVLGDFGEVVLLDWGLAKLVDQDEGEDFTPVAVSDEAATDATGAGRVLGTPAYVAPDPAAGKFTWALEAYQGLRAVGVAADGKVWTALATPLGMVRTGTASVLDLRWAEPLAVVPPPAGQD